MLWKLPEIVVPSEPLFYIGPVPISNTLLLAIINAVVLFAIFYAFSCGGVEATQCEPSQFSPGSD